MTDREIQLKIAEFNKTIREANKVISDIESKVIKAEGFKLGDPKAVKENEVQRTKIEALKQLRNLATYLQVENNEYFDVIGKQQVEITVLKNKIRMNELIEEFDPPPAR